MAEMLGVLPSSSENVGNISPVCQEVAAALSKINETGFVSIKESAEMLIPAADQIGHV
jgi:tRNA(Leu) C34 or U34 (ribose-2'-O)-methylase TrmL